ncbi:MAG TPA: hypothetical protein VKI65_14205, partial [Gemmataceae bacterium]|nr:hypothetical protein [Gemmataceae bacterium]
AIGGVIYWTLKPPSADQLYQDAKRLLATGDAEDEMKAQDDPLPKFLAYYPNDPRAPEVRDWLERIEVNQKQRQVETKVNVARNLGREYRPESELEARACQAFHYEKFGDLPRAYEYWQKLRQRTELDSGQKTWTQLAARKLQELSPKLPPGFEGDGAVKLRKDLLDQKLAEAEDLEVVQKRTRDARRICDDILTLYRAEVDPELREHIKRARELWMKLK